VMRKLPHPRILKSHECFQPHYKHVIHIVRDPRDVAVSFYHHNVKAGNIPENYPMDDFIPRFIAAEFDSRWGCWAESVISWLVLRRENPNFLMLRYEDMKSDPQSQLLRVAEFLRQRSFRNIDSTPEKLQRAVDLSTPERMRALEKEQGSQWVLTQKTRLDKPFVRTAKSGGWKSTLSPRAVSLIESAWRNTMLDLGYELAAASPTSPDSAPSSQAVRTGH
jgi:hypothetical protein